MRFRSLFGVGVLTLGAGLVGCGPGQDCDRYHFEYAGESDLSSAALIYRVDYPSGSATSEVLTGTEVSEVLAGTVREFCREPWDHPPDPPMGLAQAWLDLDADQVQLCTSTPYDLSCGPEPTDPRGVLPFTDRSGYGEVERLIVLRDP